MQFRVIYTDATTEIVEADRVTVVENSGQIVFHTEVTVMNRTREIVSRRLSGALVRVVSEAPSN
jgi:hypothetical protein